MAEDIDEEYITKVCRLACDILIDMIPKVLIDIMREYYGIHYIGWKKECEFGDGDYISKINKFNNKLYVLKRINIEIYLDIFDASNYKLIKSVKYEGMKTLENENIPFYEKDVYYNIFSCNNFFLDNSSFSVEVTFFGDTTKQIIKFYDICITKNFVSLTDKKVIFEIDRNCKLLSHKHILIDSKQCEIENMAIINDDLFVIIMSDNKTKLMVGDYGKQDSLYDLIVDIEPKFIASIGTTLFVSTNKNICAYNFIY